MPQAASTPVLLLTFDVEEFDIPLEFGIPIAPRQQLEIGAEGWLAILDLLQNAQTPATLFTTAHIADHFPSLTLKSAATHEIACHDWFHAPDSPRYPSAARQKLREITGQPILGYRSPRFVPVKRSELAAAGFTYDSSIHPVWLPGRYNNLRSPRLPWRTDGLWEVPPSSTPGIRFPMFWLTFKNIPLPLFCLMALLCLRVDKSLHLLFHPWEFTDLSHWPLPRLVRRLHGRNLLTRLARLLRFLTRHASPLTLSQWLESFTDS